MPGAIPAGTFYRVPRRPAPGPDYPSAAVSTVAEIAAWLVVASSAVAALVGGWLWWRVDPRPWFWILARTAQGFAIAQALVAGVLAVSGFEPGNWLYWLYALLPVLVGVIAEGIRLASAEEILDRRGLPDAQAVGELDEAGQRSVVVAILRREMGVAVLAAAVVAFLALRAIVEI